MGFGGGKGDTDASGYKDKLTKERHAGATNLLRRDFRLGDVVLTCWQYLPPSRWLFRRPNIGAGPLWQVDCETAVGTRSQHFYAWFDGHEEDIPAFYRIIEDVKLVK